MSISVLGVATSKFGELWDISPRTLIKETYEEARMDAHVLSSQIDAVFVGNMLSGVLGNQENLGAFVAETLFQHNSAISAFKVEGACASGGLAVHNAVLSILSGQYKTVLVLGVEKMTDHSPGHVSSALMGAGSEGERISGLTFPGLYAMIARAYMNEFRITEKDLAAIPVKNHYHASFNEKAHYKKRISVDQVMTSPYVADPLKLLECSPISDGVSAVILSESGTTTRSAHRPVSIVASAVATGSLGLRDRTTLTSIRASKQAGHDAYTLAEIRPADIDVAEVHDCFSIAELIALEDMQLCKRGGSGAKAIARGEMTLGSSKKLVVNPSGGLKACGHPVGATGVKQIVEITHQIRGSAGKRQTLRADIGLTHNIGGSGAIAAVHILKGA
jgi:acetyl-CoA C-acetyltransferase